MKEHITVHDSEVISRIVGPCDINIRNIEQQFGVTVTLSEDGFIVNGPRKRQVGLARSAIERMASGSDDSHVKRVTRVQRRPAAPSGDGHVIVIGPQGDTITARNEGQRRYVDAMRDHDMVFALGPAGTGKTYLAMAMAVHYLRRGRVGRIILTRPAIEAGESLGYLPGDIRQKLSPYLRPLYDALYDMMEPELIEQYIETGVIEVAPLAFMRGRTLNHAFVILDEAQNCTVDQLKMFLTRLGFDSKGVITGDPSQSDLPGNKPKGLEMAARVLRNVEEISFVNLSPDDVVRHPLVQKIIEAYEAGDRKKK